MYRIYFALVPVVCIAASLGAALNAAVPGVLSLGSFLFGAFVTATVSAVLLWAVDTALKEE